MRAQQTAVRSPSLALDGLHGYFHSQRAGLDGRLAARLVDFLDGTKDSLDCAIYDLRHPDILAALARLVARNVRVRIAFDAGGEHAGGMSADPKPSGTQQALADSGLLSHATPVQEHGRHLMHLKLAIRDGQAVWVGSANFTRGGLELQDNTCLEIASADLTAAFNATFEGLLGPSHRHALVKAGAAGVPVVPVGGATIQPLFAPAAGEGIEDAIVAALRSARRIRVMAFLLSDPGILDALEPVAADPRFDIRGVYDPHGMQDVLRYSRQDGAHFWFLDDPRFVAAPSHAFSPGREQDFMHNKTLIVDDRLVFTGSYNFSENAEANDEVVLAIESGAVAAAYTDYFDALFSTYSVSGAARATHGTVARVSKAGALGAAAHPPIQQPAPSHRSVTTATPSSTARASSTIAATLLSREETVGSRRAAKRSGGAGAGRRARMRDALLVVVALLTVAVMITLIAVLIGTGILHP
jgi:phosphatidylserine/phosphatidylglycerophosphate/cardiolipin synthase-like enzyme